MILFTVVRQASWSSLYDVRADLSSHSASGKDSSGPTIALQYRANIAQNTGEDWEGVVLTLSTASPLLGSDIPVLQPWKIGQVKAVPPSSQVLSSFFTPIASASRGRPIMQSMSRMAADDLLDGGGGGRERASYGGSGPKIAVSEGAISSTFEIDGLSTIPSDKASHKVSIAVSTSAF